MDLFAQGFAVDKLHRDVVGAVALADFVDMRDVGMVERRGPLCLAHKALHAITTRRHFSGQDLQRDSAIELGVLRQVNLTHPAFADLGDDAVM